MAQGVYTRRRRVTFVEKDAADCGDGKRFAMLATLDQVAEIFYRVKDARFTAGEITASTTPPFPFGFRLTAPTTLPSNRAFVNADGQHIRGYTTEDLLVSPHNAAFLQAEYDRGDSGMWRDIADREAGLWVMGEIGVTSPTWNGIDGIITNAHTMFTSNIGTTTDFFIGIGGDLDFAPAYQLAEVTIFFSGEVAVVKTDPAHSLFAPTNLYYLECVFSGAVAVSGLVVSTDVSTISGSPVTPCNYVIRLSSGDVQCPIYTDDTGIPVVVGSDFVHEATEWWPYAAGDPASPVWDTATGLPL